MRIGGQKYTIIGTLTKQGFLGLQDFDNRVIMPISSFGKIYGLKAGIQPV